MQTLKMLMHREEKNNPEFALLLFIALIGIIAFSLTIWITPLGVGVTPDSIVYLRGAESLVEGKGFSVDGQPITHYPPLYSLFLAASSLWDEDLVQAARFLHAMLFALNVGLVAAVVYFAAGQSLLTAFIAAVFLLTTTPLISIFLTALAEPLFIAFILGGITLLSLYVTRLTPFLLVASALCFGLSSVTRYVGAFLLPFAWIVVIFLSYGRANQPLSKRLQDVLIWFLLSIAPLGLLVARNFAAASSSTGRGFVFHPVSVFEYIDAVFRTMVGFITPAPILSGVGLASLNILFMVLAALLIAFYAVFFKRHLSCPDWRSFEFVVGALCLAFSIVYLLGLFFSKTFIDAATPVDDRIMAPTVLPLLIWVFSTIWLISFTLKKPAVMWSFLFFFALAVLSGMPKSMRVLAEYQKNGLYYTSRQWQESETMKFVESLSAEVRIYSNAPDPIGFLTEKKALILPYKENITTKIKNPHYENELKGLCEEVGNEKAVVVYFKGIERSFLTTRKDLEASCPVSILRRFRDGVIYAR